MKNAHCSSVVRLRFLIGLAALIAIVALYGLFEQTSGRRHLREVRRVLEWQGVPLSLDRLLVKYSPTEVENGRRFLDVIEPLKELSHSCPGVEYTPEMMELAAPGWARSGIKDAVPRFRDFGKAKVPESWKEFGRQFEIGSGIVTSGVKLLREPVALDYDYIGESDHSFGQTLRLGVWLRALVILKLRTDDIPGAIEGLADLQRLGAMLGATGTPVHHAFEMGLWSFGMFDLGWEILQTNAATDADLERLNEIIMKGNFVAGTVRSMEVELARLPDVYSKLCDITDSDDGAGRRMALWIRNSLWPLLWADGDLAKALSNRGDQIRIGRSLLLNRNWQNFTNGVGSSKWDRFRYPVQIDEAPSETRSIWLAAVRMETTRQLLIGAIALERFRLKYRDYPEQLEALVPDFLTAVPTDWFDGRSIKYRRLEPTQFLLYSVNADGVDDGGDPLDSEVHENEQTRKDMVWPRLQQ